jgi:hypothetical protein
VPYHADLKHHDAHRVGHDVVQLTRDPRTLLRDSETCRRVPLSLGPSGPGFCGLSLFSPLAQREAGDPRDAEIDRDEE